MCTIKHLLEYGTVVWSPYQVGHIEELNKVQTRFLRTLRISTGFTYLDTPVLQLEQRFLLQSLHHRRIICDLVFLFKLISDCPGLLAVVDLSVPRGTRSQSIFSRRFLPTSYSNNCGVARLLRPGSIMSGRGDIFHGTVASFRRKFMQLVE